MENGQSVQREVPRLAHARMGKGIRGGALAALATTHTSRNIHTTGNEAQPKGGVAGEIRTDLLGVGCGTVQVHLSGDDVMSAAMRGVVDAGWFCPRHGRPSWKAGRSRRHICAIRENEKFVRVVRVLVRLQISGKLGGKDVRSASSAITTSGCFWPEQSILWRRKRCDKEVRRTVCRWVMPTPPAWQKEIWH